jgi:hypothetical protein
MKILTAAFFAFLFTAAFSSCRAKQEFEYVPLEEYTYEKANIQPGTEVELLAFSGGRRNDKEDVYYYQFIVVSKETGDTLRILTPLISIDDLTGTANKTYTTPLQYNPEKGITNAFYEPKDSSQNLLLQTEELADLAKTNMPDSSLDIGTLMNTLNKNQLVVVNKSIRIFQNPRYPTAIGTLNFKQIPW